MICKWYLIKCTAHYYGLLHSITTSRVTIRIKEKQMGPTSHITVDCWGIYQRQSTRERDSSGALVLVKYTLACKRKLEIDRRVLPMEQCL